jgi:hypothetical protein
MAASRFPCEIKKDQLYLGNFLTGSKKQVEMLKIKTIFYLTTKRDEEIEK